MKRGATLAEVLVGGFLFVLLLGMMILLLVPGYRAWTRGGRKSDVQQNALVVLNRIVQEYQNAHGASVWANRVDDHDAEHNAVRHDAVSFLSDLDHDGNLVLNPEGEPQWARRLVFYHDGAADQVRSIETPLATPTTDPLPLVLPGFTSSEKDRIVARHVHSLELEMNAPPALHIVVLTQFEGYTSRYESTVLPLMATFVLPSPSPSPSPAARP